MVPGWLIDLFARYGYAAVFVGVFLENAGVPVPGETTVLAGGALSHYGHLSFPRVVVVAMTAAILGDNLGFYIGRRGGRWLIEHFGGRIGMTRRRLEDFDHFFDRHGAKTVFVARFITGLRVVCAILAGGSEMQWPTFLFFNASGAIVWSTSIAAVGYALGHSWETLERLVGGAGLLGLIIVVALVLVWIRATRQPS